MNVPGEKVEGFFQKSEDDDRAGHAHRQLIGGVGMVLPILLWLMVAWRPTEIEEQSRWAPLNSISAYYHTGAVAAFAGCLIALALFLFSYRGYDNEYGRRDRVAAIVAGGAAALIAFFPANAPRGLPSPSWWVPSIGWIHYLSAAVLFGSFIFFCLFQFPKSKSPQANLPADKQVRNRIYTVCGVAIVACMLWAAWASFNDAPIFWPETLALEFFAVSWLVKGRADKTAAAVGRQTLRYARHPRQLVDKTWETVRGKRAEK